MLLFDIVNNRLTDFNTIKQGVNKMETYYEKQKEIHNLQQNLYTYSLGLIKRLKELYDNKKITEAQFKHADLILSLTSYNLGCCAKRYTLTGLKKIQDRFKKYNQELQTL